MDSSSEDIFLEVRMKYAEDLEEILECPICLELPQGSIAQCIQGHHICVSCKDILMNTGHKCPTCDSSFGSCRNYAAEQLCAKFQDIKNSILNPSHASNRRVNKKSVEIQTDSICTCKGGKENNLNSSAEIIADESARKKIRKIESSKN